MFYLFILVFLFTLLTMSILLNQHEAAVELALKIDTDLAASCAAGKMARQPLPEETSKKLWLKVMMMMMILKRMRMMIVMKQVVVV